MTTIQETPTGVSPGAGKPRRVGSLILAGLLLAAAAVALLAVVLRHTDQQTETFDAGIQSISIDSDAGSVTVRGTDAPEVTVSSSHEWSLGPRPDTTFHANGGALHVVGRCSKPFGFVAIGMCSTEIVVDVPAGVPVAVESSAGGIDAEALTAGLAAESSAGSITVTDVDGDVDLETSAGGIDASVDSRRVRAVSSAGSVEIVNSAIPDSVVATTSAGMVDVRVPTATYRVDASTSAGGVEIDVPTSPDSPRVITATSSAGSIRVGGVESK